MTVEQDQGPMGPPLLPPAGASRRPPRVAVWGHYYGQNLGDELVASTVIRAIRSRRPDADICGISLDPDDALARHGIVTYPLNRTGGRRAGGRRGLMRYVAGVLRRATSVAREVPHLWRSYRLLRTVDLLVVAGSGQLLDQWSGAWGHPYALFRWAMLSRLTGTRVAIMSISAGPIDGRLGGFFLRTSVQGSDYISVRDQESADVLEAIGVRREMPVRPDMGFMLRLPELPDSSDRDDDRLTVGVNMMAHAHPSYWGRGDVTTYDAYLSKMTRTVCELLQQGHQVHLFSSHATADTSARDDLFEAVTAQQPELAAHLVRLLPTEIDDLVRVVAGCDAVIGARYHSVVLPMLLGIPTIGTGYHPKTAAVMRMAGQSEYCFPDIDTFSADALSARTAQLLREREQVRASLAEHIPPLRDAVERQFDRVFSAVASDRREATPEPAPQSERGRHVA